MLGPFSCDTSVVLGRATADGSTIFAKNSDRSANEAQPLRHVPPATHAPGATVRTQYLDLPQVAHTFEVIGSRPCWLWGFEMGVNEWGVAIGNEAVHTREPSEERGLIGMDIVRLALERAIDARSAVATIGELTERHGQGGSCEEHFFRTYHNSYIVADPVSAWVMETAGRRWVANPVAERGAIGNLLTVGLGWELGSPGVAEHAVASGWDREPVDFAAAYADPAADLATRACRLERARAILAGQRAPATVRDMMALLTDHDGRDLPERTEPLPTLCMHACPGFPGETAAAMVAHLRPDEPRELTATVWTAFGSPCLSLFRPVYPFAVGLPAELDRGASSYVDDTPWWTFERMQRAVAVAPARAPAVRDELRPVQERLFAMAAETEGVARRSLAHGDPDDARQRLRALVDQTTAIALDTAARLLMEVDAQTEPHRNEELSAFWAERNRAAGLPISGAVAV